MKLYKEYKEEKRRLEQEERDKRQIGLPEQTAVIYERDTLARQLDRMIRTLLLFILIAIAGACVVGICTAFG